MLSFRDISSALFGIIFTYQTPKIVTIKSYKIGVLNRLVQLCILLYIIIYAIIIKHGYQEYDVAESNVVTKVKGVASTKDRTDLPDQYRRVWDTPDYVIPPQENGAFFVMTNAIITINQEQQDTCFDENEPVLGPGCQKCIERSKVNSHNGIYTGECKPSPTNNTLAICKFKGWCPVESDLKELYISKYYCVKFGDYNMLNFSNAKPLLPEVEGFTVFIKNNIEFPKFKIKRRNILDKVNDEVYLKKCRYKVSAEDRFCPIFRLGDIIEQAGANFNDIAIHGGVINIVIKWECNLDLAIDQCTPSYSFSVLNTKDTKVSRGFNFRYANYYRDSTNKLRRDLIKAIGILFVFNVEGRARKFNFVPLILNIGAGVALLSIATVICDIILLYCLKDRNYYSEKKYLQVVEDDLGKPDNSQTPKSNQTAMSELNK